MKKRFLFSIISLLLLQTTVYNELVAQTEKEEQSGGFDKWGDILFAFTERENVEEINTADYPEILPVLSPDGKRIFFSRRNHPENKGGESDLVDIWQSDWDGEKWGEPRHIENYLNNKSFNFLSSISGDGKMVVYGNRYAYDGRMMPGATFSELKGDDYWTWPKMFLMEGFENENSMYHFNLSRDKQILLMSVEKAGGQGDKDIYVSFKVPYTAQRYTRPKSLGNVVNTAGDEITPFLSEDNKTLFFSSNGRSDGLGGQDVYITQRQDDSWTNWSEPRNLGNVINSSASDAYFVLTPEEDQVYFSSGVGTSGADIYTARITDEEERLAMMRQNEKMVLKGNVLDQETGETIALAPIVIELDGNEIASLQANEDGYYEVELDKGFDYTITASSTGYEPGIFTVSIPKSDMVEMERDLPLVPYPDRLGLENVYFDFDRSTLRPESYDELNRAYELLSRFSTLNFRVEGHTDSIGGKAYNLTLSRNRAKSVRDYLVEKGIDGSRITSEGFGFDKPIATNNTADGRQKNRRVEILLDNQ